MQWAAFATRRSAAITLADFDNQRGQLIGVVSCFFARSTGNRTISQRLQLRIARIGWQKFMTRDDAP